MRPASALTRPALVGLAALALTGTALVAAAPASAATQVFVDPHQTWTVPDGVTSIHYAVAAGPGGDGGGPDAGGGGVPLIVSGTLPVAPGDTIKIWIGQAGTDGGLNGAAGTGGTGYRPGGDGGTGGTGTGGGGGGGGSSAFAVNNAEPIVIVGGGGGGGGSLVDTGTYPCFGGGGGFSGAVGSSPQNDGCLPNPNGGAAGLDSEADGADGADVTAPAQNALLGGVGGGGGGGGQAGIQPDAGDPTGGAGGGGGQVVRPLDSTVEAGLGLTNGYVEIVWEEPGLEDPTPADPSAPTLPATGAPTGTASALAALLLITGIAAAVGAARLRRRVD